MMRYQDPQRTTCVQCGATSDQAVAMLLALSAECPKCGHSFATIGEEMRAFSLAVAESATALEIITEVEQIDSRLAFRDEDLWNVKGGEPLPPRKYLRDVMEMVNAAIARLPANGDPPPNAWELVRTAVRLVAPSVENPTPDLSLDTVGQAWSTNRKQRAMIGKGR